jgi:hypothetical protein
MLNSDWLKINLSCLSERERYLNEILITNLIYEQQIMDKIKVLNKMKYHMLIRLKMYNILIFHNIKGKT